MRFGHCYGHTKDHFTHVRKTTVVGFGFSYPLGFAVAVVTAQSHSRANGIARAAYACSGAVHCTWRPAILISRLLAAGLSHLGLGTWQPAILISRLLAAGLR